MSIRVVVLIAVLTMATRPDAAGPDETRRLRVADARTAHFVRLGMERSPLFRGLVARIEDEQAGKAEQVVVYVGLSLETPTRFAGRLRWIGAGGGHRYVGVTIRRDLKPHDYVATIAHELQHVVEVIEHPDVQDAASLAELYARIGDRSHVAGCVVWDTAAARAIGRAVRQEFLAAGSMTASTRQQMHDPPPVASVVPAGDPSRLARSLK
jgi:hypothetical protein